MAGTACADIRVQRFDALSRLPAEARVLLDEADEVFAGTGWWSVVLAHAMPAGAVAVFLLCRRQEHVLALMPLLRRDGRLESLTTPYTCLYTPLFAAGLDHDTRVAAMAAFAWDCRSEGVTRLDALPAEWAGMAQLVAGARNAGLWPLRFDHFGNWHEDVAGLDWAGYLSRRPGALRETIRRRLRQAKNLRRAGFSLLTQPMEMDAATAMFEAVYARSWKVPEPYPRFNVALMRAMADCGCLRFGAWSIDGMPVAVQVWVVRSGRATVLKLAHDEALKAHSPGTVLTALMLRHLLDQEHISEIDFGRGDDPYKRGWAASRRQRIGLLLVNPRLPTGAFSLARHAIGRAVAFTRHRLGGPNSQADGSGQP